MEVVGMIKKIKPDRITINTYQKGQEIDIFYDERGKEGVDTLKLGEQAKFEVKAQGVNINSENLVRFWLWYIIYPDRVPKMHEGLLPVEEEYNWAKSRIKSK